MSNIAGPSPSAFAAVPSSFLVSTLENSNFEIDKCPSFPESTTTAVTSNSASTLSSLATISQRLVASANETMLEEIATTAKVNNNSNNNTTLSSPNTPAKSSAQKKDVNEVATEENGQLIDSLTQCSATEVGTVDASIISPVTVTAKVTGGNGRQQLVAQGSRSSAAAAVSNITADDSSKAQIRTHSPHVLAVGVCNSSTSTATAISLAVLDSSTVVNHKKEEYHSNTSNTSCTSAETPPPLIVASVAVAEALHELQGMDKPPGKLKKDAPVNTTTPYGSANNASSKPSNKNCALQSDDSVMLANAKLHQQKQQHKTELCSSPSTVVLLKEDSSALLHSLTVKKEEDAPDADVSCCRDDSTPVMSPVGFGSISGVCSGNSGGCDNTMENSTMDAVIKSELMDNSSGSCQGGPTSIQTDGEKSGNSILMSGSKSGAFASSNSQNDKLHLEECALANLNADPCSGSSCLRPIIGVGGGADSGTNNVINNSISSGNIMTPPGNALTHNNSNNNKSANAVTIVANAALGGTGGGGNILGIPQINSGHAGIGGNTNSSGINSVNCIDYIQQQNHIFVFSTQLANKGAEAVLGGQFPTIIAYHCTQPATKSFLEDFFVKNPMKVTKMRQNTLNAICNLVGVGGQAIPPQGQWLNNCNLLQQSQPHHKAQKSHSVSTGHMGSGPNLIGANSKHIFGGIDGNSKGSGQQLSTQPHQHPPSGNLVPNGASTHLQTQMRVAQASTILLGDNFGDATATDSLSGENDLMCWEQSGPPAVGRGGLHHDGGGMDTCTTPTSGSEPAGSKLLDTVNALMVSGGSAKCDTAGSHVLNVGGNGVTSMDAIPSLQGVKVPDENLTPQQRQHREEQLAKLKKMNQFLFPENGGEHHQLSKLSVCVPGSVEGVGVSALGGSGGISGILINLPESATTSNSSNALVQGGVIGTTPIPRNLPSKSPAALGNASGGSDEMSLVSDESTAAMTVNELMSGNDLVAGGSSVIQCSGSSVVNNKINHSGSSMLNLGTSPAMLGGQGVQVGCHAILPNETVGALGTSHVVTGSDDGLSGAALIPNSPELMGHFLQSCGSVNSDSLPSADVSVMTTVSKMAMQQTHGPAQGHEISHIGGSEWSKLNPQFFEDRFIKCGSGSCVGGNKKATRAGGSAVTPQTGSNGSSNGGLRNIQGPPPPYHHHPTQRSASVPIATQSPSPASPNNPTSNLSLPSPCASGSSTLGMPPNSPNVLDHQPIAGGGHGSNEKRCSGTTTAGSKTQDSLSCVGCPSSGGNMRVNSLSQFNSNPGTPAHMSPKDIDTYSSEIKSARPNPQRSRTPLLASVAGTTTTTVVVPTIAATATAGGTSMEMGAAPTGPSGSSAMLEGRYPISPVLHFSPHLSQNMQQFKNGCQGNGMAERSGSSGLSHLSTQFCRRPDDNLPLNPNSIRPPPHTSNKAMHQFDPISSLAQMSQQLTSTGVGMGMSVGIGNGPPCHGIHGGHGSVPMGSNMPGMNAADNGAGGGEINLSGHASMDFITSMDGLSSGPVATMMDHCGPNIALSMTGGNGGHGIGPGGTGGLSLASGGTNGGSGPGGPATFLSNSNAHMMGLINQRMQNPKLCNLGNAMSGMNIPPGFSSSAGPNGGSIGPIRGDLSGMVATHGGSGSMTSSGGSSGNFSAGMPPGLRVMNRLAMGYNNFNMSPNIQVRASTPNTIQYMPVRPPQNTPGAGSGNMRIPPSLEFLQRYTNPQMSGGLSGPSPGHSSSVVENGVNGGNSHMSQMGMAGSGPNIGMDPAKLTGGNSMQTNSHGSGPTGGGNINNSASINFFPQLVGGNQGDTDQDQDMTPGLMSVHELNMTNVPIGIRGTLQTAQMHHQQQQNPLGGGGMIGNSGSGTGPHRLQVSGPLMGVPAGSMIGQFVGASAPCGSNASGPGNGTSGARDGMDCESNVSLFSVATNASGGGPPQMYDLNAVQKQSNLNCKNPMSSLCNNNPNNSGPLPTGQVMSGIQQQQQVHGDVAQINGPSQLPPPPHMLLGGQGVVVPNNPLMGPSGMAMVGGSCGGPSYKSFVSGPSPNDLKYAQQYHSFQQQLYATNTRSQQQSSLSGGLSNNGAHNASFFANK